MDSLSAENEGIVETVCATDEKPYVFALVVVAVFFEFQVGEDVIFFFGGGFSGHFYYRVPMIGI